MRSVSPLQFPLNPSDVLRLQRRQHAVDEVSVDVVTSGSPARSRSRARARSHAARSPTAPARRHAHARVIVYTRQYIDRFYIKLLILRQMF